jgi:hypothetical protein
MAEHSADFNTFYDEMERGFFAILSQGDGPHLEQVIRSEQAALYESNRGLATDEQSTFHLRCMTLALAAYRVLQVSLPKDEAFEKVRRAFIEPGRADMLREMAEVLNTGTDPFRQVVAYSKSQEEHFFGSKFTFERVQDDDQAYKLHVSECFLHRFFSQNGAPELTRIGCDSNASWIDAIDPAKHGVLLDRPSMLGYGGDKCRFYFYRLPMAQEEGNSTPDVQQRVADASDLAHRS